MNMYAVDASSCLDPDATFASAINGVNTKIGDISTLVDSSPDLVTEVNTKPSLTTVTSMLDAVYATIGDTSIPVPTVDVDAVNQVLTSSGAVDIRDETSLNTVTACTDLFNGSHTAYCTLEVAKTIGRTLPVSYTHLTLPTKRIV